jgi:hypothetical protein
MRREEAKVQPPKECLFRSLFGNTHFYNNYAVEVPPFSSVEEEDRESVAVALGVRAGR